MPRERLIVLAAATSLTAGMLAAATWPAAGLAFMAIADVRAAAADASLFLLVGGLVMLTIICVLVLVQNLLPDRDEAATMGGQRPTRRQLRALDGGPLAQHLAQRKGRRRAGPLAPVDLALDRVVELHLGEPRLLQAQERASRVRLYGCRGCAFTGAGTASTQGCTRECAALEEVFGAIFGSVVRAQESACRRRGDAACEFEVAH